MGEGEREKRRRGNINISKGKNVNRRRAAVFTLGRPGIRSEFPVPSFATKSVNRDTGPCILIFRKARIFCCLGTVWGEFCGGAVWRAGCGKWLWRRAASVAGESVLKALRGEEGKRGSAGECLVIGEGGGGCINGMGLVAVGGFVLKAVQRRRGRAGLSRALCRNRRRVWAR